MYNNFNRGEHRYEDHRKVVDRRVNMFSNKREPRKITVDESKTVLGSNAMFKGELTFKDTLCIDGEFEGKLTTSGRLIVAEQGTVLADIEAGTVICKGKITGNIIASQKVEIHSTGKILGDVHTPALMIELGAVIHGKSDMDDFIDHPPFSVTELTPPPIQKLDSKDDSEKK